MVLSLSPVSLAAIAILVAALAVGWSRRFLAAGCLAIANVVIFVLTAWGPQVRVGEFVTPVLFLELGLQPQTLVQDPALGALQAITSMFLHDGILHLLSNLIILLAFALPFEERIGHRRFIAIYLLAGIAGGLAQVGVIGLGAQTIIVGASGAVFGIIGAFAAAFPNLIVPLPLPLFVVMFFVRMRVWIAAVVFGAIELFRVSLASPGDNTAYFAHFGGLAAGIVLGWTAVRKTPATRRPVAVDLGALSPFARDVGTSQALAQMKTNHDEPQIFQAWLDRFFRTAACPTCGHKVMPRHHGEIVCTQGHRFDVRQDRKAPIAA
jgi:membrane associated rhomboid family serine protease